MRDNQDQVDLLQRPLRRAPRRTRSEAQRIARGHRRQEEPAEPGGSQAPPAAARERHQVPPEQAQAQLAVLRENKNKSLLERGAREAARLQQAKLLSPMSGLVAVRQNRDRLFHVPGMQMPDIREGDQVQPGIPVADVLDLSEMEVVAKVGELDRANLHEGQDVTLTLDALPDKKFHGKIKSMSGTASANVFSGDPAKKFDVVFSHRYEGAAVGAGRQAGADPADSGHRGTESQEAARARALPIGALAMMAGAVRPARGRCQPVDAMMAWARQGGRREWLAPVPAAGRAAVPGAAGMARGRQNPMARSTEGAGSRP